MNATDRDPLRLALIRVMDKHRLTQEDVALLADCDRTVVSRYASGQFAIPLRLAVSLARAGCPELLDAACREAEGRLVQDAASAPAERVEGLRSVSALLGGVQGYAARLNEALADRVLLPREHEDLAEAARELRRAAQNLEAAHEASVRRPRAAAG